MRLENFILYHVEDFQSNNFLMTIFIMGLFIVVKDIQIIGFLNFLTFCRTTKKIRKIPNIAKSMTEGKIQYLLMVRKLGGFLSPAGRYNPPRSSLILPNL